MSARADRRPAGDANDADAVRRRQLLLFSVVAAVVLVAVAVWLCMGGGKERAPEGGIETQIRELRQEARTLRADNERLRAKLEGDPADARDVIDRQAALIDELRRGMQAPAQPGNAPGAAPGPGEYFRAQSNAPPDRGPGQALPGRTIETFELDSAPQSSAADPRTGQELVADAVAKPVSVWLPAGAHAQAVVLAGVDASAGVSSQRRTPGDRCSRSSNRLHRAGRALGEWLDREFQCPTARRTPGRGDLLHPQGSPGSHRVMAVPLQRDPPIWQPGIPAAVPGDDRHAKLVAWLRYAPPGAQLG